jgi:lipopolysaccharide/colanic/teichoic acid biosynthesis glycosyltransferase
MTTKLTNIVTIALLWPLALVSALAVRLESAGPVLVDEGGLKFRTTTPDGRTTRLGRFLRKADLHNLPGRFIA